MRWTWVLKSSLQPVQAVLVPALLVREPVPLLQALREPVQELAASATKL